MNDSEVLIADNDEDVQDAEAILEAKKRGRGRPKDSSPEEEKKEVKQAAAEDPAAAEDSKTETQPVIPDELPPESLGQDFVSEGSNFRILAELVRSQNQSQENMIRAQNEFSNSVMDRMDNYQQQVSRLQREAAEQEKSRLRADYREAQDRADEYLEEIHQLRIQLDTANRKVLKLTTRMETVTSENASLKDQLDAMKKAAEQMEQERDRRIDAAHQTFVPDGKASEGGDPGGGKGKGTEKEQTYREGWLKRRRRRRYLEKILGSPDFTVEQKAVIREADQAGIPFESLLQICNPDIPPANMKMMVSYMKR